VSHPEIREVDFNYGFRCHCDLLERSTSPAPRLTKMSKKKCRTRIPSRHAFETEADESLVGPCTDVTAQILQSGPGHCQATKALEQLEEAPPPQQAAGLQTSGRANDENANVTAPF
jgi:hypothetical protein